MIKLTFAHYKNKNISKYTAQADEIKRGEKGWKGGEKATLLSSRTEKIACILASLVVRECIAMDRLNSS